MTSDNDIVQEYKQFIPIENLVTKQIDRIMMYRSEKNLERYEESVEALIDLLSPDAETIVLGYKKENGICFNTTSKGKDKYVDLFRFIKKHLASENIIWKRSRGYEKGHD